MQKLSYRDVHVQGQLKITEWQVVFLHNRFVSLVGNTMSEERLGTIAKLIELGDRSWRGVLRGWVFR